MENQQKLTIANLVLMALVGMFLFMDVCAHDRLEDQVIRLAQAVESGSVGGGGARIRSSSGGAAARGESGTGTGATAVGWGGNRAEITWVEGGKPGHITLADKPKPQGDSYVNRRGSAPSTLNYYTTSEGDASTVTSYIYGRLMSVDPDSPPAVQPDLATSWEVSDDKLTYTYTLRKGVQHADGRPFTADDVVFTFNVMRDPEVRADHLRSDFADVESVTAPDPYTVVVQYSKPYWKGLYAIGYTLRVLNKGWYEEQIPVWAEKLEIAEFSTEPGKPGFGEVFNKIRIPCPGTGPYYYTAEEYGPETPVILAQNPFYFGIQTRPEHYNMAKMRWVYISDQVAAFEEFRKQKFDVTVVNFQSWDDEYSNDESILEIADYYEYDHTGLGFSYIAWNARKPPFDDPRVRKAMTHLVDRQWMVDEYNRGRGSVAVAPTKPTYPTYSKDIEPWPHDIDEAKRLLAEAGWTDSDGDGVLDRNGERFEFEFKVGSPNRFYTQLAAQLEDSCKQVGIRMTLRTIEWSTFIEDLYERRFDAVALYASFPDPWHEIKSFHSSQDIPRGENTPGWHNDRVDELADLMNAEFDEEKRYEYWDEFNHLFHEEQPMTLINHSLVGVLVNKRLEDVTIRPSGLQMFDFYVEPENVLHE